ncbi:hypothetical protein [Gryllotalpicola protaetiae]|nr:hypothetical protein [Gryllotalpicola protaetiae]
MQFGFSYVGAAFLVALFVPNLIWARHPPDGYDPSGENRVLRALERIGQVAVTGLTLFAADTNPRPWSALSWFLAAAVLLMIAYEACWVRYFRSSRTLSDFYRSAVGVPVPLATLPVTSFVLLGIYGESWPVVAAAVVLGVGHLGIHLRHAADTRN